MSDRDPFAPPDETGQAPLGLARDPSPRVAGQVHDGDPKPRQLAKPIHYPRPQGGRLSWIIWLLAAVGAATCFALVVRQTKRAAESAPRLPTVPKLSPVTWHPVMSDDAVLITVRAQPRRGLKILHDGQPVESNPVRLARGDQKVKLIVSAEGHDAQELELVPDRDRTVDVTLRRSH